MDRIINPYNSVAFYTEVLEEHNEAPLYSPHNVLPPWQIEFDTSEVSGSTPTVKIIDSNFAEIQSLNGVAVAHSTDSKSYVTYRGHLDLSSNLNEGIYRIKITTNTDTYYSHPICAAQAFQSMDFQMLGNCTSASGGGFDIALAVVTADPDMERNVEYNQGNGWVWLGTTSGTISSSDIVGSGAVTIDIRRNVFYPDGASFYKEYDLLINDTASGCAGGSSLTATNNGGREYDNWFYLEFYNDTDLSGMGLLYQSLYKQRVYFHGSYSYPEPVVEETFFKNGQNEQFLESAAISEQVNIDVYPVPDYLLTVLQNARYHSNVNVIACADGKTMPLTNFSFTSRTTDGDNKSVGVINGEINSEFIKGCQTNKTLV